MIDHSLIDLGLRALLGLSLGVLITLLARVPVLRWFGPQATYSMWWMPPLLMSMALWPTTTRVIAHPHVVASMHASAAHLGLAVVGPHSYAWLYAVEAIWLIGAAIVAVVSAKAWTAIRRAIRHAQTAAPFEGIAVVRSEQWRYGPAVTGVWRSVIVLPADFDTRYSESERFLILAHEATHARRFDGLANGFTVLLVALAWFNPLVWLGVWRFRRDQELACDASVLSRYKQHRTYGEALMKTHYAFLGPIAACNWLGLPSLKERVMMIKQPHRSDNRRRLGVAVVMAIALGSSVSAYALSSTMAAQGSIAVQIESTRANGVSQSSVACVAANQDVQIPYDHAPGDLGNLYFHVSPLTGNPFADRATVHAPLPPLQWEVYGFTPMFDRATADGMRGDGHSDLIIYSRNGSTTSLFYGKTGDLKVDIKVGPSC